MVLESTNRLRMAVAVATAGRAPLLHKTIPFMFEQARTPDRLIVVGASPQDVAGLAELDARIEVAVAAKGLPRQRNHALSLATQDCDVIVFFDDDFLPARDYLTHVESILLQHPDVAAVTGRVPVDGVHFGGYPFEDARADLDRLERSGQTKPFDMHDINHMYGCNMAARLPAAAEVGFDERLPLYAWQEDRDFSRRLNAHGRIVRASTPYGIHLGVTVGRSPGLRLGYSQVANPLYLLKKGTMRPLETLDFVGRNIAANLVKSVRPEPWIDRVGRLRGNALAIGDALLGRDDPQRILKL
jgi:hypothetical protein